MGSVQTDTVSSEVPRREPIEALFAALESPLLSYALRLLADRALAEDTVQEAFMKLHIQFDDVQEPRRWLYRTVHNLSLNHQRAARRMVRLTSESDARQEDPPPPGVAPAGTDDPTDPQPLPDEHIARWEGIGLVRLSLDGLEERSREIVRLKFLEDLSYKEISVRTGLTPGHVGYLLHHALKTIASELAKTGVVP